MLTTFRALCFIALGFLLAGLFFIYTSEGRKAVAPQIIRLEDGTSIKAIPGLKIVVQGNMTVYVDENQEQCVRNSNITLYIPK